jgi:hypothetical protein
MHRVIRKRIRRKTDGVDLALDLNADVAINVGDSNVTTGQRDRRTGAAGETGAGEADSPREPGEREATDPKGREL